MPYILSLVGGIVIGISSLLMLYFNGRILGVSGIIGGIFQNTPGNRAWRYLFLSGLVCGGLLLPFFKPDAFLVSIVRSDLALVAAGLLVGYGTRLGSGCTSGHGVCGVSRLSPRSLLATLTFMACGMLTVFMINHLFGGSL